MELGENIMLIRKKKGMSQAELGRIIGTSGDVVGRYERGDINPSIDVVTKIADALSISIDYLVGKTSLIIDSDTLKRLEDINALKAEDRDYVFSHMDMMIRDFKNKHAYSK